MGDWAPAGGFTPLADARSIRERPGVIDSGNIAATLHPTQEAISAEMDFPETKRNRAGWNAMNRGIVL
jgi:hypothetical protein